ncbi:Cuticle protein [Homarus americanus]|uniref:Cuticle protein n=1 Tax=Homarus americanus TaxID=6706 RepID=A0A8J5NBG9_HOMAM|nr:Cuticle protein [Homarus americanus]
MRREGKECCIFHWSVTKELLTVLTTFTCSLLQLSLRPALFGQTGPTGSVWGYIRELLHQPDIIVLDASPHTRHEALVPTLTWVTNNLHLPPHSSLSYPLPDGSFAEVSYTADEFGYNVNSPLLPTPHPLPAHAQEQIRIAEEQRAQGITFE